MKRIYLVILIVLLVLSAIIFLSYNIYNCINYVPRAEEINIIGNEILKINTQTEKLII